MTLFFIYPILIGIKAYNLSQSIEAAIATALYGEVMVAFVFRIRSAERARRLTNGWSSTTILERETSLFNQFVDEAPGWLRMLAKFFFFACLTILYRIVLGHAFGPLDVLISVWLFFATFGFLSFISENLSLDGFWIHPKDKKLIRAYRGSNFQFKNWC